MYLNKFSVPDISLDRTTVEQAALADATIVTPSYYDNRITEAMKNYIKETSFTYSDGTEIEVVSWENVLDEEGNLATRKNIVIYQPTDMLLEMLGNHMFDNIILVENNDSI